MESVVSRTRGLLVIAVTGKMDGFGSQKVTESLQASLLDTDRVIVFDLAGVDYISSAGLRVFQEAYRKMRERQGTVTICNPGEFVLNVLKMGGFLEALTLCSTLEDALAEGSTDITAPGTAGDEDSFFESEILENGETNLQVTGSITAINQGRISTQDIHKTAYRSDEYEIGIGAVGNSVSDAEEILGNMVTMYGSVMWIPADGNQTPDYFTRDIMTGGGISRYAVFSAAQEGPFHYLLRLKRPGEGSVSMKTIADEILKFSREKWPDFKGVCSVSIKATIEGLCTSDIVSPVIASARDIASKDGMSDISHSLYQIPGYATLLEKVSLDDTTNRYRGETLLAYGYIVDLKTAGEKFSPGLIGRIALDSTPMHPARIYTNISGAVLRNIPWEPGHDITTLVTTGLEKGTMTAMHHLLGISTIRNATIAIAPISSIHPS